jgi:four helix bundle protein
MKDFKKLKVWQESHDLILKVYKITMDFPKEELFGLISQIRRSAVSIAANIAEGCGRGGDTDFARFLQMAMGSASELEYHLLLSKDLNYIRQSDYEELNKQVIDIKRMIATFINKLKADSRQPKADR